MLRTTLCGALAASFLLVGAASSADAQFASPIRFNVHGGAALPMGDFGSSDATNPNARLADLGFRLGVGLEFRLPMFPLGLRLDGDYDRMRREGDADAAWSIWSASLNAIVSPMMLPLYFIGGVGFYSTDITGEGTTGDASSDFGFNLGAGFSLPVPGFSPFIEARWNRIRLSEGGETANLDYVPIVIGFRF